MKAKRKKKSLSLKRAAKIISDNILGYLKTLPASQRKKRLESGLKYIKAKVASAKVSSARVGTSPKLAEPAQNTPTRLVARSGR